MFGDLYAISVSNLGVFGLLGCIAMTCSFRLKASGFPLNSCPVEVMLKAVTE